MNDKGTPMSTPRLIEGYAGTHPGLTDREIATALGLGHQQVEHALVGAARARRVRRTADPRLPGWPMRTRSIR
jgi:hypothetical protein